MKKFDNHVTNLQKEMIDITNNLKKFRNKNHKTISLLINNLNILSNEIINHQLDYDDSNTNISNKQSNYDELKSSVDLKNEEQKFNQSISQKKYESKNRNRNNSIFSEKNKDNYKTFFHNNSNKKNDYIAHTSRRQYFKIENNKYNGNHCNDFFSKELINNKNSQTLNKFYNRNNKLHKNNSLNSKLFHKNENSNINNLKLKNEHSHFITDNKKKKNNTLAELLLNNKKDFIYFNKNKQNYIKQNARTNKINKFQTCYYNNRNRNSIIQKSNRKMSILQQMNFINSLKDNSEDIHENYKNNSDSSFNNINNNIENEQYKNNENVEILEINNLLKSLKLKNINDLKQKLKEYHTTDIFTNKVISLFYKYNTDVSKDEIDLNDVLNWISSLVKIKRENEEYKLYCKNLMEENNIKNFKEFKSFIDKILNKNIQNNNFIGGVKKILSTNIDDNSDFNFDNINY